MHKWKKTKANGTVEISRTQIPLALAWALTIHKCQGMSLDRVRMDLAHVFSEGQAYVALSRARTLDGMEVMGYKMSAIRASDRVREFYVAAGSSFGVPVAEGGSEFDASGSNAHKKRRRGVSGDCGGDGDGGGDGGEGDGGDGDGEEVGASAAAAAAAADGFLQHGDAEVAADALAQAARGAAAAALRAGCADPSAAAHDELMRMAAAAIDAGLRAWRERR